MKRIQHFVAGQPAKDEGVLPRLRWPIPQGVAQTYAEAYAEAGETVVVPYCQGPTAPREILAAGRRVLALNFDPALILAVQAALAPPPSRELDAAVARLGDTLKQGVPLRRFLADLYATTCPACARPAVADYYVWDRDSGTLIAKGLRCPACAWQGQTVVDAEDRERLSETPAQSMHYHYILDRIAPEGREDASRARLEQLLELYSPRNLYALAELTIKLESLFPDGPLHRALKVLLLDCLDRCSSLTPLPSSTARRRGLSRPGRYLEYNVWHAFEDAATRFRQSVTKPVSGLANTLGEFHWTDKEDRGFVGEGMVRDLPKLLPPRSIRLILSSPPPLDPTTWVLSYLWGAWLLGTQSVASLRPLLRQRTPDPAWYAKVMTGSFRTLAGLLPDDGRLVWVLSEQRPAMVEALVLAASRARLGVAALIQRGSDYRLELTPTFPPPAASPSAPSLKESIVRAAEEAAIETIRARAEPTAWRTLHAAILQRLAERGLLSQTLELEDQAASPLDLIAEQIQTALESPTLRRMPSRRRRQELWRLATLEDLGPPLCDQVEEAAYEELQNALALSEADFSAAVYARFPGLLTPDAGLVAACLRSFGYEATPGYWQLRAEDLPDARQEEHQSIVKDLLALGRRLGYRAIAWGPFDVAWFEGELARAVFVVRWRAALNQVLALVHEAGGAVPHLVIPGGRAALVSYKLAHNPPWRETVDGAGWRFIKYRHVRQLVVQEEVDEYSLQTIVGLDPIVEREAVQIPLF